MGYNPEQKETMENYKGYWHFESDNHEEKEEIFLNINSSSCRFIKRINGKEIESREFAGKPAWFGPWLDFMSAPQQFYARYANSKILIFGEKKGGFIGEYLWEKTFNRVAPF